jgi:hypothetical protein
MQRRPGPNNPVGAPAHTALKGGLSLGNPLSSVPGFHKIGIRMKPRFLLALAFVVAALIVLFSNGPTLTFWACVVADILLVWVPKISRKPKDTQPSKTTCVKPPSPFMTIRMKGREPVRIRVEEWPVQVKAGEEGSDAYIVVRRHQILGVSDGRVLVYGHTDDLNVPFWSGYLLDLPSQKQLNECILEVNSDIFGGRLGQDCLSQFPPEAL